MKLVPGVTGWPQAYEYKVAGSTVRFDQSAALPPILHLTFFNPLDDHYGFSPLEAAAMAVDTHNAAAIWNKALLDNAARPSGALVYDGADGAMLSTMQYERLRKEFDELHQGMRNAGRPLVLEGGLDWKPMSFSPSDMDFLEAKHARARAEQEWARTIGRPNGANTTSLAGNPGPKRISTSSLCNGDLTGAGARRPKPDLRLAAAPRSASLSRRHQAAAGINDHVALE